MPFFSIIIPTYNSEKSIGHCLDSILNQTYTDFEVLLMDGLSTDSTLKITSNYNDPRIKIFSESDDGVYDAMNKSIVKASGEWLYFIGSDDVLYDDNVLYDLNKFADTCDADFVYGNVIMAKENNIYDGVFDINKLYTRRNICHQAIFYKKILFHTIGKYNLEYRIWADWDLNIRSFSHPLIKTIFIDRIICIYNDESGISALPDSEFSKFLPAIYLVRITEMEKEIQKLRDSVELLRTSNSFKLGHFILYPFKYINRIIKQSRVKSKALSVQ